MAPSELAPSADEGPIPVIDVAPFRSAADPASDAGARAVARAMGAAFEHAGFVVIVGHGLPPELGEKLYGLSAQFHDLPDEVKADVDHYIPYGDENVSQLIGNMSKPNDLSDRLSIQNARFANAPPRSEDVALGRVPADFSEVPAQGGSVTGTRVIATNTTVDGKGKMVSGNPREAAAMAARAKGVTAEELVPGIQAAGQEYFDGVHRVWQLLQRMSEVELGLPLHYFDDFYPEEWGSGSLRCYPTFPSEEELEDEQLRFGAHTDSGGLTLLRTDMEGLQVNVDGTWHDVPVVEGGLVINVARLLARWTNDRWTAAIHRVKNDQITTHRKLTLGMFTSPLPTALIEALPTCVTDEMPAKFEPILAGEHGRQRGLLHVPGEGVNVPEEFWRESSGLRRQRVEPARL